jgi:hypothetical protein
MNRLPLPYCQSTSAKLLKAHRTLGDQVDSRSIHSRSEGPALRLFSVPQPQNSGFVDRQREHAIICQEFRRCGAVAIVGSSGTRVLKGLRSNGYFCPQALVEPLRG